MRSFTILAALIPLAMAYPYFDTRQVPYIPCSGTYSNAECCATDVLGLADLDCANPPSTPSSMTNFTAVCSAIGQRARCCALPVLGQALLCQNPT